MVNYQLGKVYKIVDNTNGNIYIGSTCKPYLSNRLAGHRTDYQLHLKGLGHYITSFEILKNGDYDIVLLEECNCDNKMQLHARERFYIDSLECVNKSKPLRNIQEWRQDNKEKLSQKMKEYNQAHKEQIKEYIEAHKDEINAKRRETAKGKRDEINARQKKYYNDNKEHINEQRKKMSEEKKDEFNARRRELYKLKKQMIINA